MKSCEARFSELLVTIGLRPIALASVSDIDGVCPVEVISSFGVILYDSVRCRNVAESSLSASGCKVPKYSYYGNVVILNKR